MLNSSPIMHLPEFYSTVFIFPKLQRLWCWLAQHQGLYICRQHISHTMWLWSHRVWDVLCESCVHWTHETAAFSFSLHFWGGSIRGCHWYLSVIKGLTNKLDLLHFNHPIPTTTHTHTAVRMLKSIVCPRCRPPLFCCITFLSVSWASP